VDRNLTLSQSIRYYMLIIIAFSFIYLFIFGLLLKFIIIEIIVCVFQLIL
jgi:hypothetical protein